MKVNFSYNGDSVSEQEFYKNFCDVFEIEATESTMGILTALEILTDEEKECLALFKTLSLFEEEVKNELNVKLIKTNNFIILSL